MMSCNEQVYDVSDHLFTSEGEEDMPQREGSYKKPLRKRSSNKNKGESALPAEFRSRLHGLFTQIEKEFEALYLENLELHEKLGTSYSNTEQRDHSGLASTSVASHFGSSPLDSSDVVDVGGSQKPHSSKSNKSGIPSQQKVALRLKQQTSKIVSSFKTNVASSSLVKEFLGHKDGIWDVTTKAKLGIPVIGTASADHSACVWAIESARCLLKYQGHSGSVNSIRFHPSRELALTASGDQTAHIWQASVAWDQMRNLQKAISSEEEFESSEKEENNDDTGDNTGLSSLRTPSTILSGHSSVVICADWLTGGEQLITASWDRTAILWDVPTGEKLQVFSGHDQELSYAAAHPVQRLFVTTSKDATFRLWDVRSHSHSVSVFQGHTENITSACFSAEDKLVSGSDDRTIKIWDIRNMRAALVTIRLDSAVNRLSVSNSSLIAVPHDDRNVRILDFNGHRVARLPRSNRQGHRTMVTSTAWGDDPKCNLFTCGFDRVVMAWNIQWTKDREKAGD